MQGISIEKYIYPVTITPNYRQYSKYTEISVVVGCLFKTTEWEIYGLSPAYVI